MGLPMTSDFALFAINWALASAAIGLIGIVLASTLRTAEPWLQHHILLAVCLVVLLLPVTQYVLFASELGMLSVDETQFGNNSWPVMVLILVWLIGSGRLFARFVIGLSTLSCFRRSLVIAKDERLTRLLDTASQHVGLESRIRIATTHLKLGPMVLGWRRPVIAMPLELRAILSDEQLLCILVHECEHVRRRDVLTAMLQQFAACLYWWNPFYLLAARKMEGLRERACDDKVTTLPNGPRDYTSGLIEVAEWIMRTPYAHRAGLALLSGQQHDVIDRIHRIRCQGTGNDSNLVNAIVPVSVAALLTAIIACVPIAHTGVGFRKLPQTNHQTVRNETSQQIADSNLTYLRNEASSKSTGTDIAEFLTQHRTATSRGLIIDLRSGVNKRDGALKKKLLPRAQDDKQPPTMDLEGFRAPYVNGHLESNLGDA